MKFDPQTMAHPYPEWKCRILEIVGIVLGVQFKIGGMPYGAAYNHELWNDTERDYAVSSTATN